MRSTDPMPGNPWPHDMSITIEDAPPFITDLLFVRSVWGLDPAGVPPLSREPEPGTSLRPRRPAVDELERLWLIDWDRAWSQFQDAPKQGRIPDENELRRIAAATDEELREAFSSQPSAMWSIGVDREAASTWRASLSNDHRTPLAETPERRALPALIHAWRHGIDTIIQLPYRGHYARQQSGRHLVVSQETRHNPDLYAEALNNI